MPTSPRWLTAGLVMVVLAVPAAFPVKAMGQTAREVYSRGVDRARHGQFDLAIADFTEAIRLDPKAVAPYANADRGHAYAEKGEFDKAIADLTDAIRLGPTDANVYGTRGGIWVEKGEFDRAIADLTEAIRLDPKDADAYSMRGRAWAAKGDRDKAAADDRQAELLREAP